MSGLIGGSASTGSSLLRQILHRHSVLFCGSETALFTKAGLYTHWPMHKKRVLRRGLRGLRSAGWHMYNGTDITQVEYGWTVAELDDVIDRSDSFPAFAEAFFARPLGRSKKQHWLEKTPANACCFHAFLNTFSKGRVILTVRDPLDTIASMLARGVDPYYAAGVYLMNTAMGLGLRRDPRFFMVLYESLVRRPPDILEQLCTFLEIAFEPSMLKPDVDTEIRMDGWAYDETKSVESGSIGRFQHLSFEAQQRILHLVHAIRLRPSFAGKYGLEYRSIPELAKTLGYACPDYEGTAAPFDVRRMRRIDMWKRTWRLYPYHIFDHPMIVRL